MKLNYRGLKSVLLWCAALVDTCISQLRASFARRVVGLNIKCENMFSHKLLIHYVGTQSLIIKLQYLDKVPRLNEFLVDESICFCRCSNELESLVSTMEPIFIGR